MQHCQGEKRVSASENIPTGTMDKPETVSVAAITKEKQQKQKSICLARDEEASPKRESEKESEKAACSAAQQSQEQEEEETEIINEAEAIQSLLLSELQDTQKNFSCQKGKQILGWLPQCWNIGVNSKELQGMEAWQLASLAKDKAVDKGIRKRAGDLSFWW